MIEKSIRFHMLFKTDENRGCGEWLKNEGMSNRDIAKSLWTYKVCVAL